MALGPAFGLPNGAMDWWYDNNGKVFHLYSSPQYREFLTTMNQWYKEGLIDAELNRDESNFQSVVSTNVVGAFTTLDGYQTLYNNLLKTNGVSTVNHLLIGPPQTPDGSKPKMVKRDSTWSHYGITRDAKNPDLAMQWINFIWGSDEGVTMNEYGIEGKSFTRGADGKPKYTDFVLHNSDGLDAYNALRSLGASNTILVRTPAQVYIDLMSESPAILAFADRMRPNRVEPFPAVMLSDADQSIIDRIQPDIGTYVAENLAKFLIGEQPLSAWNNYVQTLNSIGLADVQKIRQQQYDRSK
jgi:putative aldouronate transport system substrate-binding protein